jgi:MFS family permease
MVIVVAIGPKPPVVEEISSNNSHDLAKTAKDFKTAMFQPATLGTLVVCFALSWVFQAIGDLTPSYLAVDPPVGLGKGALVAGSIYSSFSIAFMFGAMASGFVTNKIFKGRSKNTILIGFIVAAITTYGLNVSGIISQQGILIFDLVICGLFMSMVQPPAYAFIASYYPEHVVGKVGGTIVGLSIFGGVGGATAGAYALHATGHYTLGVIIMVAVMLIGAIGTIFIKPPKLYESVENNHTNSVQQ